MKTEYISVAKQLLLDLFHEDWMNEQDWAEFEQKLFESGLTYERLGSEIQIGVNNGHSVDYQVQLCKQLLEGIYRGLIDKVLKSTI